MSEAIEHKQNIWLSFDRLDGKVATMHEQQHDFQVKMAGEMASIKATVGNVVNSLNVWNKNTRIAYGFFAMLFIVLIVTISVAFMKIASTAENVNIYTTERPKTIK